MVKNPPANIEDVGLIPGLGRSSGRGNGKLTPVFLPGESHGQRSLVSYSPWDHNRVGCDLATKQQQQPEYRGQQEEVWIPRVRNRRDHVEDLI